MINETAESTKYKSTMIRMVSFPVCSSNMPKSEKIGCTISGAESKCSQKATSEFRVMRFVSEASQYIAIKKVPTPKDKTTY